MNKKRIKLLREVYGTLEAAKATLEELHGDLDSEFDAKSDRWKGGDAGETAGNEKDYVEQAKDSVESALDSLGNVDGITG